MILAFHKPYGVISQFTPEEAGQRTLADFGFPKGVYPIGRLDLDSEGLLILTDERALNDRLLNPKHAHERAYHVQVEGDITDEALQKLMKGVVIQDYKTMPCIAEKLADPGYPPRDPPIRVRKTVPESWLELKLIEGKNRQVRRMTAAAGFPTLRLIRSAIGNLKLGGLKPGEWREITEKDL